MIKKHRLYATIFLSPFLLYSGLLNNSNVDNLKSVNIEKTDISTIFSTLSTWENLDSDPNNDQVYSYLSKYLTESSKYEYLDVINDLLITKIESGKVYVVANEYSRYYTGSFNFNYTIHGKVDISTLIGDLWLWNSLTIRPTNLMVLQKIKELKPEVSTNQLSCNVKDITFSPFSNIYYIDIKAAEGSNLYCGTATLKLTLHLPKTFTGLGMTIEYGGGVTVAPTLNDNVITLNQNGFYVISTCDNSSTYLNRCIATANNTNIQLFSNVTVNMAAQGTNCIKLGENSTLDMSVNSKLTIAPIKSSTDIPAAIRVPYTSSFVLTGREGTTFKATGASGRCAAAGIGGDGCKTNVSGQPDRTTSYLSCGDVQLLGKLNVNALGGSIDTLDDAGGGSAGIGGGGCCTGYAGDCKSVTIDITGKMICTGSGSGNYNFNYSCPGCCIGGGSSGSYNQIGSQYIAGTYIGGSLHSITINSGVIYCNPNVLYTKQSVGSASTIGGGVGSGGYGRTKNVPLNVAGGDLDSFVMNGGFLITAGIDNAFADVPSKISSVIGGGGCGSLNRNTNAYTNSKAQTGSLKSFVLNAGNIYINKNSHRCGSYTGSTHFLQYPSTIGPGGHATEVDIPSTRGTTNTFTINNGSIFQSETFETGTNTFTKQPTNSKGETLYPCLVPSTINGVSAVGKTLNIPSINYSCNLENLAEYNSSCQASGCLWLPVGNYTDIMIDGIAYSANVTAIINPTTTENIVL